MIKNFDSVTKRKKYMSIKMKENMFSPTALNFKQKIKVILALSFTETSYFYEKAIYRKPNQKHNKMNYDILFNSN